MNKLVRRSNFEEIENRACARSLRSWFESFLNLDETSKIQVKYHDYAVYGVLDVLLVKLYDGKENLNGAFAVKIFTNAIKGAHCQLFNLKIQMYTKIIPRLNRDVDVIFPRHFYSPDHEHLIEGESVIVLEDLTYTGFCSPKDRFLSIPQLDAAMKSIGFFHGEIYSWKLRDHEDFIGHLSAIDNVFYPKTEKNVYEFCANLSDTVMIKHLEEHIMTSQSCDVIRKAKTLLHNVKKEGSLAITRKLRKPVEPMAVLCHGDFNANNLMFRHNDDGTVDCKILDLQLPAYGSPVIDLAFILIMNMASSEERKINLERFINIYLEAIISRIKTNLDPQFEVPAHLSTAYVMKEFKEVCFVSYFIVCLFLPVSQLSCTEMATKELPGYFKLMETFSSDDKERIMTTPCMPKEEEIYLTAMYDRLCAHNTDVNIDKALFDLTEELLNYLPSNSILVN